MFWLHHRFINTSDRQSQAYGGLGKKKKTREYEITINDQLFITGKKSNEQMMIGSFSRHTFSSVCDIHLSVTFKCFLYLQFKPTNRYKSQQKLINFN